MSIRLITGLPRSGKTWHAIQDITLGALREGRKVYTNVEINTEAIIKVVPAARYLLHKIDLAEWLRTPRLALAPHLNGAVHILDEAWMLFPSTQKSREVQGPAFQEYLAMHGHRADPFFSTDIVFIVQRAAQLAKWARELVEIHIDHKKMSTLGVGMVGTRRIMSGVDGPEIGSERYVLGGSKPLYISQSQRTADQAGISVERMSGRGYTIWHRPATWLFLSFIFGIGYVQYNYWSGEHFFSKAGQFQLVAVPEPQPIDPRDMLLVAGLPVRQGESHPQGAAEPPPGLIARPVVESPGRLTGYWETLGLRTAFVEIAGRTIEIPADDCDFAGEPGASRVMRCRYGGVVYHASSAAF